MQSVLELSAPRQYSPRYLALYCALVLGTLIVCISHARAQTAASTTFNVAALDRYMEAHLARTHIPGMAIALVRNNTVVLAKGYGRDADGLPITPDSKMLVASLSKSFTAMAICQLVESGRLALDDRVQKHLPEFALHDARVAQITVRQLLNQTSGMSDRQFSEWANPGPKSLEDAVARLHDVQLQSDPGTEFHYHNPNFHVAARLVEVVSGESFESYLRNHIFAPLNMTHSSTVNRLNEADEQIAHGHVFAFAHPFARAQPAYFVNGAAGVITTANDMAQWLIVHANEGVARNGERVLSASGIRTMQLPNLNEYGLGWTVRELAAAPKVFHDGWAPTFTAYQAVFPKEQLGVAVLTNVGKTTATEYEPSVIASQIVAIYQGQSAISHGEDGINADLLLAALAIVFLGGGFYCMRRAPQWAIRFCDQPWHVAIRLTPYAVLLVGAIRAPDFVGDYFGGRAATWLFLSYFSPLLVAASLSVGLFALLVLSSRCYALWHLLHKSRGR